MPHDLRLGAYQVVDQLFCGSLFSKIPGQSGDIPAFNEKILTTRPI